MREQLQSEAIVLPRHNAKASYSVDSSAVVIPISYQRAWHWPFDAKRLSTTHNLKVALLFLVLSIVFRIIAGTTLWLSDDEAWYWGLSKTFQASYAVHPPLSMWLIRLSTALLGDSVFAVRLPSIVCSALGCFWIIRLVARLGWAKGADATAVLSLTTPLLFLGGILTGPDLPLFALWAGAMDKSYAIGAGYENSLKDWMKLGVILGLALLSKYTAFLALAATCLWILTTRRGRAQFGTVKPYAMLGCVLLLFSPVIYWNAIHNWDSFQFQFISRHGNLEPNFKRWGIFWISQAILFGPAFIAAWFLVVRNLFSKNSGLRFLAIWALLPGGLFFAQPLFSDFKIHWALFAFIPTLAYFAQVAAKGTHPNLVKRAVSFGTAVTVLGLICIYTPVVSIVSAAFGSHAMTAKNDFTNDFYGWDQFNHYLSELPPELHNLPLVSSRYQIASQAAFAIGSKEQVRIYPTTSYEVKDWGSPQELPARFLYIADNRYNDSASDVFKEHRCTKIGEFRRSRFSFLAKEIYVQLCIR